MKASYQPDDLVPECIAAQQEADKAMSIKNDLRTIMEEEKQTQEKNLCWLETHGQLTDQWARKIENNINLLDEEITYQARQKSCLKKAILTLKTAANINAESQFCRSTKLDGDYRDEVARELEEEKHLIDRVNSELETGLAEIEGCTEKMRAAKQDLEYLWSVKRDNYNIECENINLKRSSSNTMNKFTSTREINKYDMNDEKFRGLF